MIEFDRENVEAAEINQANIFEIINKILINGVSNSIDRKYETWFDVL